jgi:acyl carrier protein
MDAALRNDPQAIHDALVQVVRDMIGAWDRDYTGDITARTRLVADLGCESIDIVMLIASIEEKFRCKGLPFDFLLRSAGRYVSDLTVGQVADFLATHLS